MKDLRTEVFRRMYEEPIHPKNLWLRQEPFSHKYIDEYYRRNIRLLIKRGAYTAPAHGFEGAKFFPMDAQRSPDEAWADARHLWDETDD
jgi:beta-ureidopropionase